MFDRNNSRFTQNNDQPSRPESVSIAFMKGDFTPNTLYKKLNLNNEKATTEQILDAFRHEAGKVNPDHTTDPQFQDGVALKRITRARDILGNPNSRAAYDYELAIFRQLPESVPSAQNGVHPEQAPIRTATALGKPPPMAASPIKMPPTASRISAGRSQSSVVRPEQPPLEKRDGRSVNLPKTVSEEDTRINYDYHRLGVLVIDGSSSMDELGHANIKKRHHVAEAIQNLVDQLCAKQRKFAYAYDLAFVYFNTEAIVHKPIDVTAIPDDEEFDPIIHTDGGNTRMDIALQAAHEIARQFLSTPSRYPHALNSATIIVLGDGMCHAPNQTIQVAEEIRTTPLTNSAGRRANISVKSAYIQGVSDDPRDAFAAQKLMKNISGDNPAYYATVDDAESLERFYFNSLIRG